MIRKTQFQLGDLDRLLLQTDFESVYLHLAEEEDHWQCDFHCHPETEIGFIFNGNGIYQIGEETYSAAENDVFIVPAKMRHYEKNIAGFEPMFIQLRYFSSDPAALSCFITDLCGKHSVPDPQIRTLFHDIYHELILQKDGYISVIDAKIKLLLLILYRSKYEIRLSEIAHTSSVRNRYILEQVEQYINEHIEEAVNVDQLARKFYYHPKTLSRMYKNITGKALSEYIAERKLRQIKKMLENTTKPVCEIAQCSGFSSAQAFYKFFKKEEGITPVQYRMKYQAAPRDAF